MAIKGGLDRDRLAAWHLPVGPVGPPARWTATSNVVGGSGTKEGAQGRLAICRGLKFLVTPLLMWSVSLTSLGPV